MSVPRRHFSGRTLTWSVPAPSIVGLLVLAHLSWGFAQGLLTLFELDLLSHWLQLSPEAVTRWEVWRFATYALVHSGVIAFVAGLLGLILAGRELEPILGRTSFLALYGGALVAGGVAEVVVGQRGPAAGNLAGVAALVSAFATILPELEHRGRLFFLIPVRFRAKHLAFVMVCLASAASLTGTFGAIAPAGMLCSAVLGWVWCRSLGFGNRLPFERAWHEKREHAKRLEAMDVHEFVATEVDPILEKIARTGMRSLSGGEKKMLQMASNKFKAIPDSANE